MKVAIVHDWLYGGGAEKVVEALHRLYPEAPIYTSYCTEEWRRKLDNKVVTGYLSYWPLRKLYKFLPLLRQWWFKRLDLAGYDLVISSSGNGEARFVLPNKTRGAKPIHVSYTHTPTHFYWRKYDHYMAEPSFRPRWLARFGLKTLAGYLRAQDYRAAQSIDYLIANSEHIKTDIKTYYGRDSEVIHPPVDTARFAGRRRGKTHRNSKPTFITWGRHVPYKRFDIAVKTCSELGVELVVIGQGPETKRLREMASDCVRFTGWVSSDEMMSAIAQADAFIFPGEEDFGIAPVEALAAGLPVIAYKSGGALDFVDPGVTGIFFDDQSVESLKDALAKFKPESFDPGKIRAYASTFNDDIFRRKFQKFITKHT